MKILIVVGIITVSLIPNVASFIGSQQIIEKANGLNTVDQKVAFIDDRTNAMTFYTWVFRANKDDWKFLLSGAGQCGEMAAASNNLMHEAGITSRIVDIPGEHSFVEVKVNGDWLVADGSSLITRKAMAEKRESDVGSLSYIIAPDQGSFVELTQEYTNTDTIIITLTKNGEPIANMPITLCRFGTLSAQLPSVDYSFYSDVNGTVPIHLGSTRFIGKYQDQ